MQLFTSIESNSPCCFQYSLSPNLSETRCQKFFGTTACTFLPTYDESKQAYSFHGHVSKHRRCCHHCYDVSRLGTIARSLLVHLHENNCITDCMCTTCTCPQQDCGWCSNGGLQASISSTWNGGQIDSSDMNRFMHGLYVVCLDSPERTSMPSDNASAYEKIMPAQCDLFTDAHSAYLEAKLVTLCINLHHHCLIIHLKCILSRNI